MALKKFAYGNLRELTYDGDEQPYSKDYGENNSE